MANIYRCVKCKSKLGEFFNPSPYRCKNRACRKTYCYDCCKTGLIFTDTTCCDCGSPAEEFNDDDDDDDDDRHALKSIATSPTLKIDDEKDDDSEEEDLDFELIFSVAHDEFTAGNFSAAVREFKEAASLTNDDGDLQICYEMIAHIHEQKLGAFEDLLVALKYFRWSEKLDGFMRVLHKLTTHPQVSKHTEALIKHVEVFKRTTKSEETRALLDMQLQQLQNHKSAQTAGTTGNAYAKNTASSKLEGSRTDKTKLSFATKDARLLGYISQAIHKGYMPEIFADCLSEHDIVEAMGDFMMKKYLDLGYPSSLFEHCSLPLEVKNAAEKYRSLLGELKSIPQKK